MTESPSLVGEGIQISGNNSSSSINLIVLEYDWRLLTAVRPFENDAHDGLLSEDSARLKCERLLDKNYCKLGDESNINRGGNRTVSNLNVRSYEYERLN